jgi:hypothetical protein
MVGVCELYLPSLEGRPGAGSFEHERKSTGSLKGGDFLN